MPRIVTGKASVSSESQNYRIRPEITRERKNNSRKKTSKFLKTLAYVICFLHLDGVVRGSVKLFSKFADFAYKHGYKLSYHNHSHEFIRYENGKTAFEMLAEGLDKEKVAFVLDTYWVQHGGADVRYWIEKLKGRIEVLHLKDMKCTETRTTFAEVGQGNLWWDGIIKTAEECGVRHFVVEQDKWDKDSLECIRISSQYLHQHFIR
jgi:sugar phosphate isomerase/epimerase